MPADIEHDATRANGTTDTNGSARVAAAVEPWEALGTELLVDEEHVKCWVERVAPGETRPAHTHRHPWITVVVSGASGESRTPDGELIAAGSATAGDVRFNGPDRLPFSHYLANTSDETLVMVAVELRGAATTEPCTCAKTSAATDAADSPTTQKD